MDAISSTHLTAGTTSPFLPGTNIQYAWDSTCLGLLKQCPRLYQYTIIDGWGTRDESVHLRFGIEYHTALQDYAVSRANGIKHDDAIHDTISALVSRIYEWQPDITTRAGKYKNRESLIGLVVDYLDHFVDDPASTFILETGEPAVELSFRFALDWGPQAAEVKGDGTDSALALNIAGQPYLLCGHLDRVVNYFDDLFVMDRKTSTSTLSSYFFQQFDPNNQMSLYSLAGQVVLNSPVKGVIIDAAQVLMDSSRFVRHITYRTPDQQEEWLKDLRYWLALAESYATENYWPQNDTSCNMYGGCRFREVCSKSPHVRDRFLESHFIQLDESSRWNPLKPRGV